MSTIRRVKRDAVENPRTLNKKTTPSEIRARNHLHRCVIGGLNLNLFNNSSQTTIKEPYPIRKYDSQTSIPMATDRPHNPQIRSSLNVFAKKISERVREINSKEKPEDQNKKIVYSSEEFLWKYGQELSESEVREIKLIKKVYFHKKFNEVHSKKTVSDENSPFAVGDQIGYRYEVLKFIDSGSFGHVLHCVDHKSGQEVAVKMLKNSRSAKKRGLVEFKIVSKLGQDANFHNCIVRVKRKFEYQDNFFIVFELLSINLYEFIKKKGYTPLSPSLVKRITVQLLRGLSHMHALKVIHCDLKPENITFKNENKSSIRIIDFGSSCFSDSKIYTYIQSRFYRAPEIVFKCNYSEKIDIWSLGCIVVEMLTGEPLFIGDNEKELLECIVEVIGMPPRSVVERGRIHGVRIGESVQPNCTSIAKILAGNDNEIINFVESCIRWVPEERTSAKDGLSHSWIRGNHSRNSSIKSDISAKKTPSYN